MEELNKDNIQKDEYNNIPVSYCKKCLSLKILVLDEDTDYCDECGSTEIETTDINTWNELYIKKYGKPLINNKNGRK